MNDVVEFCSNFSSSSFVLLSILSCSNDFCSIRVKMNAFRSVTLLAHRASTGSALKLELKSKTVDDSLLQKLEIKLQSKITDGSVVPALEELIRIVESSRLLACGAEIAQLRAQFADSLKLFDSKGFIQLTARRGSYFLRLKLAVPADYPIDLAQLSSLSSNLPDSIQQRLRKKIVTLRNDIIGSVSRLAAAAAANEANDNEAIIPSLGELKHDVRFLNRLQDMKNSASSSSDRRQIRRLEKAETKREEAAVSAQNTNLVQHVDLIAEQENFLSESQLPISMSAAAAAADDAAGDVVEILPPFRESILPIVSLAVDDFLHPLTSLSCFHCEQLLLPRQASTTSCSSLDQLFCGCWFHAECLQKLADQPPFSQKKCPRCSLDWSHLKFNNAYLSVNEQRYYAKQRAQRELDEIHDFLM